MTPSAGALPPPTTHQVLLELLRLGLSWAEAHGLGAEEVACLLHHAALERDLQRLSDEAARVAGLPLADPHEQQRLLVKLQHQGSARLARFYREG